MKVDIVKAIISQNGSIFDYGGSIGELEFRALFGLSTMTDQQFTDASKGLDKRSVKKLLEVEQLEELSVSDAVRNVLLDQGKYFYKKLDRYHVALPSQTNGVIAKYQAKASRALKRADRLASNAPVMVDQQKCNSKSIQALLNK